MAKQNPKDEPFIENYPLLKKWVHHHAGHCMWQVRVSEFGPMMEGWMLAGASQHVIIMIQPRGKGWDVYTTLGDGEVAKTLIDAEMRLGLKLEGCQAQERRDRRG